MAEWTPNDFSNIATVGAAAVCSIMMVLFKSRCSKISLCFGLYACDCILGPAVAFRFTHGAVGAYRFASA